MCRFLLLHFKKARVLVFLLIALHLSGCVYYRRITETNPDVYEAGELETMDRKFFLHADDKYYRIDDLEIDVDKDELKGKMRKLRGFYEGYKPYLKKDQGPYNKDRFPELTKMVIIHTSKEIEGPNFVLRSDDIISMDIYMADSNATRKSGFVAMGVISLVALVIVMVVWANSFEILN